MRHLLNDHEALLALVPELEPLKRVPQPAKWHPEGCVWNHTLLVASHVPDGDEYFLAALLHDLGKEDTTVVHSDGRITAYGHENVSAERSVGVLDRLGVSDEVKREVLFLVQHHMKTHAKGLGPKAVRRLLNAGGVRLVRKLVKFGYADVRGSNGQTEPVEAFERLVEEVVAEREWPA